MEYAKVLLGICLFIALCGLGSSAEEAAPSEVPPVAPAVELLQLEANAATDTDTQGARKVRQFFGPPPPPPPFFGPPPPPPFGGGFGGGYGGGGGGFGGGFGGGYGGSYQRTRVVTRTRYRGGGGFGGFGGGYYG